jgi:DNA sulfur modification protein DndD
MILNEMTLTNFGIYKGEHTVELSPKSKKPITLFGAYNGSGKTTFLDALQIVLYGKLAKTSSRGKTAYDDYLRSLINRDTSKKIGAGLKLVFTSKLNGRSEKIEVSRTWHESGTSIKEVCEVKRDDRFDQTSSERWHEFVEEYMPSEISELFFFDGEKIEGLADPLRSSSILKNGIYSLLGINSIESLIKSLTQIEKRKAIEIAENIGSVSLDKEETLASELAERKAELNQNIGAIQNSLDRIQLDIDKIEADMKLLGADLLQNRRVFQEKQKDLNTKKIQLHVELVDIAAGNAPLLLVKELIDEIKFKISNSSGHSEQSLRLFTNEVDLIKSEIRKIDKVYPEAVNKVADYLDKRILNISHEISLNTLTIDKSEIPTKIELNDVENLINSKIRDSIDVDLEIDVVQKNLQAVPEEEKINKLIESLNNKQKDQVKDLTRMEMIQEELNHISSQQDRVEKEIAKKLFEISSQKTNLIVSKRVLNHSRKSKDTLIKFKSKLINKHLESLSHEITDCFRLLHRKNNFELKFIISEDDFSLRIFKLNNEEIPAKTLSAGERQLLSVAILWALAKSSGKTLPTVIDTPLGRLDGPHRQKLIKNYFPKASDQVLIFSTDEEVTQEHYESLKTHISNEYCIEYDETSQSSVFKSGYFTHETR